MDESLKDALFEAATIFENGYGEGFRQFEVKNLRFAAIPMTGGGEYDAVVFVERAKRKEKIAPIDRVLVLDGWDHPKLETVTLERLPSGTTIGTPKFTLFHDGWNQLLDDYVASNDLGPKVVFDGRRMKREDIVRRGSADGSHAHIPEPQVDRTLTQDFSEGGLQSVILDRFERDAQARDACLQHYGFRCRGCGTLLSEIYGPLGEQYIHVHHRVPLSEIRAEYRVDPVRDLVPVCPNCHAMIHRSVPPISVEDLADVVRRRRHTRSDARDGR